MHTHCQLQRTTRSRCSAAERLSHLAQDGSEEQHAQAPGEALAYHTKAPLLDPAAREADNANGCTQPLSSQHIITLCRERQVLIGCRGPHCPLPHTGLQQLHRHGQARLARLALQSMADLLWWREHRAERTHKHQAPHCGLVLEVAQVGAVEGADEGGQGHSKRRHDGPLQG